MTRMISHIPVFSRLPAMVLATLLMFSGCSGYQLGSTLPPDLNSIFVPTFVNSTKEPSLEVRTTRAVIEELQRDGSLKVTDALKADATLLVEITKYELEPVKYQKTRIKTPQQYIMTIEVNIVVKARLTGKIIAEATVDGYASFEPKGDMTTAKREALPATARDLAHDIVEVLVEYWE